MARANEPPRGDTDVDQDRAKHERDRNCEPHEGDHEQCGFRLDNLPALVEPEWRLSMMDGSVVRPSTDREALRVACAIGT